MPLNKRTTRFFHRVLYAGILEKVILLKRDDDQRQGTIRSIDLYQCRWSKTYKSGEPIQGDMSSSHSRVLHIPRCELDRIGVEYINAIDMFQDEQRRLWQPESVNTITVKLFANHICVECLRVKDQV